MGVFTRGLVFRLTLKEGKKSIFVLVEFND